MPHNVWKVLAFEHNNLFSYISWRIQYWGYQSWLFFQRLTYRSEYREFKYLHDKLHEEHFMVTEST